MQRAPLLLAALLLVPLACVDAPERQADADAAVKPESPTPAPAPAPAAAQPGSLELSPEELELLDADPKTLSPEQNRKRAFALRKKIMQDPNSPAAKALEEARQAALGGELPPEQIDPDAKKEGVVIELPEHLQDQRVSKLEPTEK